MSTRFPSTPFHLDPAQLATMTAGDVAATLARLTAAARGVEDSRDLARARMRRASPYLLDACRMALAYITDPHADAAAACRVEEALIDAINRATGGPVDEVTP